MKGDLDFRMFTPSYGVFFQGTCMIGGFHAITIGCARIGLHNCNVSNTGCPLSLH